MPLAPGPCSGSLSSSAGMWSPGDLASSTGSRSCGVRGGMGGCEGGAVGAGAWYYYGRYWGWV